MADTESADAAEKIFRVFVEHGAEFLVVGGQAEAIMGSPRPTYDTDLAYRRSPDNLERIAQALKELNAQLRVKGQPLDIPFPIDARSLFLGNNFTFCTDYEDLDILGWVEPIGGYEDLMESAEEYPVAEMSIKTIGLDDLIRVKEHICRQKDSESLYQLKAIRKVREETGLR